jgi:hypothetical protein
VAVHAPLFAEEIVDLRTTSEMFQGKDFQTTTGRVVLHAAAAAGGTQCGRGSDQVEVIDRAWDVGYLPHLPRCRRCATEVGADGQSGPEVLDLAEPDLLPPGRPALGVDIRTVHGSDQEKAGADALFAVLAEHDVSRWLFTDLARVDDSIRGGFSHPLTIMPQLLVGRPARALATFLHEQLHWSMEGPGADAATTEASSRWPDPPGLPEGGHDDDSTWLHMSVCALEFFSLSEIIGAAAAEAELRQQKHYSWIYEQILAEPDWFADFLARHDLRLPDQPPAPRRYYGEDWWTNLV